MSKKRKLHFAIGGIVSPSMKERIMPDSMVTLSEEEREKLARQLMGNVGFSKVDVPAINIQKPFLPKPDLPKVESVNPGIDMDTYELHGHLQAKAQMIEAQRRAMEHPVEANHPMMEFLEDIVYCPSQIDFYFRDEQRNVFCLYIRQRHGETTAEIIPCMESGDMNYDVDWKELALSQDYDIEGAANISEDEEDAIIQGIERECLGILCEMFPKVLFPEHPNRRRGRLYHRLEDKEL